MEQSDKVSRTIDKYLRLRFGDEKADEQQKHLLSLRQSQQKPPQTLIEKLNSNQAYNNHTNQQVNLLDPISVSETLPPLIPACSEFEQPLARPTSPSIFLKPSIPGTRPHAIPIDMLPKASQKKVSEHQSDSNVSHSNSTATHNSEVAAVIETQFTSNDISAKLKIALITIQNSTAICASIRNDLKYIAIGFENSQICIWKTNYSDQTFSIDKKYTLFGHSGPIYSIVFLENDLIISASEDTTIRMWSLNNCESIKIYRGHTLPIWQLELSPSGSMFASGSMDSTSKLWSFEVDEPIRIFSGHDKDVEFIKFHPNEKYVATGSCDKTVRMWSVADGRMVRVMVGHKDRIVGISFLPDGQYLATASADGCIKIWMIKDNLVTSEILVPAIRSITFNFEQQFVSCCGTDNILRQWHFNQEHRIEKILNEKVVSEDSYLFLSCFIKASFNILFAFEYIV